MELPLQSGREEAQYVFNLLQQFPSSFLFLDLRSAEDFSALHLSNSFNLPLDCESSQVSVRAVEDFLKHSSAATVFAKRKRMCIFVAGDEGTAERASALFIALQKDRCKELHLLSPPVAWFLGIYTFLAVGTAAIPHTLQSRVGYPNEIIPDRLFLGSHLHGESFEVVQNLRITHIVNATKSIKNKFLDQLQYCRVVVEDQESEMICYHFNKAFRFMDMAFAEGPDTRILVHCAQGISRSATLVMMYLMRTEDMTYERALALVQKHRSIVQPNPGFEAQLKDFEASRFSFRRSHTILAKRNEPAAPKFSLPLDFSQQ
jgi:protein-tyrosine phosphatase